ncbi:Short-chain dehydrogenase/reductase [Melia azedarach]|uniref:(21S)-21-acetoxyl-apo-melianone synthase SDR n=2 Tax=Melia azedarach TaxID=155640 RepID=SDR_MELAZ|nr:Short-chain dehydrogenase/reductase [Melia azedarach]WBW48723.1 SDR [Melia azedarach]
MNSYSSAAPGKRLEGKVAIITGGASGIGATAVQIFHDNGAKVVISDVQDKLGQALADKLGEGVSYIHCDISNENDVINLVDTTVAKYGKLDIMYNNAGVIDRNFGSILDTPKSDLERLLSVNTIGGFLGAKHAARVMVPKQKGCILFTASACTEIAGLGSPAYTVSKYGVVALVKSLAAELGQYGIRVNCVSPYGLATGMSTAGVDPALIESSLSEMGNLKGQVLKTDGIANAALYLACDEASYVSGQNLVVDGGFSILNPTIMKAYNLIN